MKITPFVLTYLEPEKEGYILRNKEDITIISKKVSLSVNDSIENWEEVEEEKAILEKEEYERQQEEMLNELINNTVES